MSNLPQFNSSPLFDQDKVQYVSVSPQKCTKFFEIDKDIFEYQLVEGIVEYHLKMHQVLWLVEGLFDYHFKNAPSPSTSLRYICAKLV